MSGRSVVCKMSGDAQQHDVLQDGHVVIYEIPSDPHGTGVACITGLLYEWIRNTANSGFVCRGAARYMMGAGRSRELDVSMRPRNLPSPGTGNVATGAEAAHPNLVVEVGCSQTVADLHSRAAEFFAPYTTIPRVY